MFDDDLARDVRDVYRRMLRNRVPDHEAARRSIEEWSGLSSDEEPIFWLALASVQFSCGRLDDAMRKSIRRPWCYVTDLEPETALAWTASTGSVAVFRVVQVHGDAFTGPKMPVLERLTRTGSQPPPPEDLAELSASDGWLGWEPVDPAAHGRRPAAVIPLRLRKRDPDWADLGFSVCGYVPARPGDDAHWQLGVVAIQWDGLVEHLENRLTTGTSEQR